MLAWLDLAGQRDERDERICFSVVATEKGYPSCYMAYIFIVTVIPLSSSSTTALLYG